MAVETTEQIVREAPDIEAYKLGLLESAKALADKGITIPPQMVAEMSELQVEAGDLAAAGIGGYQPYLQEAGYTLGDAQTALGGAMAQALPFQEQAAGIMGTAAAGLPSQVEAAQLGIQGAIDYGYGATGTATGALTQAAQGARNIAGTGAGQQMAAAGQIPGVTGAAASGMAGAAQSAFDIARAAELGGAGIQGTLAGQLAPATAGALTAAQQAAAGGIGAYEQALAGSQLAIQGARGITGQAATALQQAGALGTQTAQEGIAGLAGTTGAYQPTAAEAFMSPYESAAVQQAIQDIARAGQIQRQQLGAQAVGQGAFGGSRQAVAEQELARNVLEQQGRTAAQMRAAGYQQAATQAQQAFEAQQARAQQAAQLTGALGAQGAQAGLSAAQAAGQLGLSAEQLAAAQAGQLGQLGLSAQTAAGQQQLAASQLASANAQALAQTGLNLEQLQAQTGLSASQLAGQLAGQAGQLGLAGTTAQADIANRAAALGISAEQLAGQLAAQSGQLGQAQAQLGTQAAQAGGQLGISGAQAAGQLGQGLGALGAQYGQLGIQQGTALGTLGLQQASLGELTQQVGQKEQAFLFDLGKQQQAQQQAELEAARSTELQQLYEPYQRIGFLSDIYKGAPTSQQAITGTSTPNVSPAQQILGLGVAGLSAAAGAKKAFGGLF